MSKLPVHQPDEEAIREKKRHEHIADAVGVSVMNALGHPSNLFRVSVFRLWKDHYRVNVQTRYDAVSVHITHSFFVSADDAGNVVESNPRLARVY